jgi:hypothetical protein
MLNILPAVSDELLPPELLDVVGCPPELTLGPPELLLPHAASVTPATASAVAIPIQLVLVVRTLLSAMVRISCRQKSSLRDFP